MGAIGVSVKYQANEQLSEDKLRRLHRAVWRVLEDFMGAYVNTEACRPIWGEYIAELPLEDRFTHVSDDTLTFYFPDYSGFSSRSMGASFHWAELALASRFDRVGQVLQEYGAMPAGERPDLGELVWQPRDNVYVTVDGELYQMSTTADVDDANDGLHGDNTFVAFSELADDDLERLAAIAESKRCPCPMCTMLRPDDSFESAMADALDSDNPEMVQSAMWYLRNAARPSVDTAVKMAAVEPAGDVRSHGAALYEVGSRQPADALDRVCEAFGAADDLTTLAGLAALAAGVRVDDDAGREQARLDVLKRAIAADPPVCEVVAEYVGYGASKSDRASLGRALAERVGASEEMNHGIALTLFNFYLNETSVPQWVIDAIADVRDSGGSATEIAEYALGILEGKDRR